MLKLFINHFFICYLFISSAIFSQSDTSDTLLNNNSISSEFLNDVKIGFNNEYNFFKRPLSFDKNDWLLTSSVLGLTSLMFIIDEPINKSVKDLQTKTQDDLVIIGHHYGNGLFPLGLSAVLYSSGLLIKNRKLKNTGQALAEALIASGITVTVFKVLFGRSRPFNSENAMDFNFFKVENKYNSFFSGHAIIAFTTSAVLSSKIDNIFASIALYGLASLTAYQRIYSNNHWLSDTFLGAVTGIFIGNYFANLERGESKNNSKFNLTVLPIIDKKNSGFSLQLQF